MFWYRRFRLKSSKPEARIEAARALGEAGEKRAVPFLIAALNDGDPRVQSAAAEALSRIPHPASVEPLISLLAKRADKPLAQAIAAIGPPAAEPLIQLLASENKSARRWSAFALGLIGDPQAVGALAKSLEDKRSEVRQEAAAALGKIGGPDVVAALIAALSHRDLETRKAVIEALGMPGNETAIASLAALTENRDESIQVTAVRSLAKIGGIRAAVALGSALESDKKAVREAAQNALKSMEVKPASSEERAVLAVLTGDFETGLREGDAAVQALVQALASRDPRRRAQASESLVKLGSGISVQALLQALRHHEPEVRDVAARALASIGVPALKGLLDALAVPAQASQLLASRAAAGALEHLLRAHAAVVPQDDLRRIAEFPDPVVVKEDGRTAVAADCTAIRALARQELLRRA